MSDLLPSLRSLNDCLKAIDWYRQCLQDQIAGHSVRSMDEAQAGYDHAFEVLKRGVWLSEREAEKLGGTLAGWARVFPHDYD